MKGEAQESKAAAEAAGGEKELQALVEALSGGSRRERQQAAKALAELAREDIRPLVPFAGELVDALNRPEAQTRWEALDILTEIVPFDSRSCDKALVGAETALFDEDSGPLRLAAMRFLCKLGSTTENRSEKVWPLVDEGIQCYHGDLEFQDMLASVVEFSCGKLSGEVKRSLAARMSFDAENSRGSLKRRALQILENVSA